MTQVNITVDGEVIASAFGNNSTVAYSRIKPLWKSLCEGAGVSTFGSEFVAKDGQKVQLEFVGE